MPNDIPGTFPGASVSRRKLPVGDYGLMLDDQLAAVVERKSFDNLLGDVGALQALHHQLADLATIPASAMVIEADYRDFLCDASRLANRWPASHMARVLAELAALHPRLPIVYAGNRKMANAWTNQFFLALGSRQIAPSPQLVLETVARYDAFPRAEGIDERIRRTVLTEIATPFTTATLANGCRTWTSKRIRRVMKQLRRDGLITRRGRGRGSSWDRLS